MRHSTELRHKLQQINDDIQQKQHMKVNDIDVMKSEFERYINDLRTIQTESNLLDRLMEESNTTITDSTTNRNIFFVVECRTIQNLVDTIENKVDFYFFKISFQKFSIILQLIQRRIQTQELDRLLDDFTQSHTSLLHRINSLTNNLRTARLLGYSARDIEDLMIIVKVSITTIS